MWEIQNLKHRAGIAATRRFLNIAIKRAMIPPPVSIFFGCAGRLGKRENTWQINLRGPLASGFLQSAMCEHKESAVWLGERPPASRLEHSAFVADNVLSRRHNVTPAAICKVPRTDMYRNISAVWICELCIVASFKREIETSLNLRVCCFPIGQMPIAPGKRLYDLEMDNGKADIGSKDTVMRQTPARVFLIDDHPIVEAGLKLGFGLSNAFSLIGSERTHDQALNRVEDLNPDVILSDLVIAGELDLTYLTQYRTLLPKAHLVAFSSLPPDAYAEKCSAAGADGFVSKATSPHELVAALTQIMEKAPAPEAPSAGDPASKELIVDGVPLTPRESEVGLSLARGQSTADIAARLKISKKTAAIHRDNLRKKLHCRTSNELIALLARNLSGRLGS